MNNKRGSSAVFLMVILAALVSITLALIHSLKEESIRSQIDAVTGLAGDSVMSEFNYEVQREYGLFLIKGTDEELSAKLKRYIKFSLDDMDGVNLQNAKVTGSRYSVVDMNVVRQQLIGHLKFLQAEKLLNSIFEGASDSEKEDVDVTERVLRHGPTIVSLPSAQIPEKSLLQTAQQAASNAADIENAFKSGSENYLINSYVLNVFNSKTYVNNKNHFFSYEAEYILHGDLSDKDNEKGVETALKKMRFTLNLAHIYADSKKREALTAVTQVLMPGAAGVAAEAALASTWAYAEADNDIELLQQGYKVPVVKDDETWAIDIDSAVEGVFSGTVKPQTEKGYNYGQYLQILLYFQDENMKLARILDLIQINTRKLYDEDFLIYEHAVGISADVKVNGRHYAYDKKY